MAITKIKTESHEEWLALRHKYIGGSDSASVVGLNPFSSAYHLWAEKTDRIPGFEGNLATEVGTYLEEFVAKKFEQETGKSVYRRNASMVNDEYPFAIANVDRLVHGEDAGLEIKTTSELSLKKFKNGEYPANYYCQCMHYMAVTGKAKWYLAVLIGNHEFRWFEIPRDDDEIKALMDAERSFWECVKNNTPPAIDGSKSSKDALAKQFAESDGTQADFSPISFLVEQYQTIGSQIDELTKSQDEVANQIKLYLGDSEFAENERYKVSWKSQTRNTFDSKRYQKETGYDLSSYYKTSSYRVFKVGVKK